MQRGPLCSRGALRLRGACRCNKARVYGWGEGRAMRGRACALGECNGGGHMHAGKAVRGGGSMHVLWGSAMMGAHTYWGGDHMHAGDPAGGQCPGPPSALSQSPPLTSGCLEPCSPRRGPRGGRSQEQQLRVLHSPSCRARNANPAQRLLSRGSAPLGPRGKKRGEKTQGKLWAPIPCRHWDQGVPSGLAANTGWGHPHIPGAAFAFTSSLALFSAPWHW